MPEISRFSGGVITMYYHDHPPPYTIFQKSYHRRGAPLWSPSSLSDQHNLIPRLSLMLQDIVAVEPLENYQLRIHFEDGVEGIVPLSQLINFTGVFAPLTDPDYFATVKVNPDWGTIYWENGADLDPDVLYYLVTNQTPEIPTVSQSIS